MPPMISWAGSDAKVRRCWPIWVACPVFHLKSVNGRFSDDWEVSPVEVVRNEHLHAITVSGVVRVADCEAGQVGLSSNLISSTRTLSVTA